MGSSEVVQQWKKLAFAHQRPALSQGSCFVEKEEDDKDPDVETSDDKTFHRNGASLPSHKGIPN